MSLFIKRTFLFFLVVILLITVLQVIISIRISGKTVNGHDNLELTSNINANLVFLGSSRCWAHFDPSFFDSTYHVKSVNIAVDGHSELSMAIARLKDYLSRNKPPQKAILSFDPFISAGPAVNTNFVHKDDFARYAFFPSNKNRWVVDYFGFNFYEKYVPLYAMFKYKRVKDALLLNNRDKWFTHGYSIHSEKRDTLLQPVNDLNKKDYYTALSKSAETTQALGNLKQLCEQYKIKLICVQTPVYKAIYDEQFFSETGRICSRLNIPFIDANIEAIRNDVFLFYNSNHLNKSGVNKLNAFLKNDSLFNSCMK